MKSWAVAGWVTFANVLVLSYAGYVGYRLINRDSESEVSFHDLEASPTHTIEYPKNDGKVADFELTDQSGQPFGMQQLRGKVWVASFFFASCPGTCRQLNLGLAAVQDKTPDDVMLVSLTCDPDNDTSEQLARYATVFHADPARWKFLTGKLADLRRVGFDIFQVAFDKQVHSERAFVVDRQGRIRSSYNLQDKAQADNMVNFVRELDQDSAPAAESSPAEQSSTAEQSAEAAPAEQPTPEATVADAEPAGQP